MNNLTTGEKDFNFGWKFSLDNPAGAELFEYDDSSWRQLRLPHDWSIELSYDQENGEGATAYLLGGIGWYRKEFELTVNEEERNYIYFDGVYNNAEFWLNGNKLGFHPYGYSPFYYDVTPFLRRDGGKNVIAVKVDRTRYADSRWYTGSGIYRNVSLITKKKVQIPIWGTYITTPSVSEKEADVQLNVTVRNGHNSKKKVTLHTALLDASGNEVVTEETEQVLKVGEESIVMQNLTIDNPNLWGLENPALYTAVTRLFCDDDLLEEYSTRFGIRSIHFDADEGFFLNGENVKIKGVCLHHDAGLVGAAVPKGVWRRRLQTLKESGCNGIRLAHNPASKEFLELCDEMGFLVQNEFFDEWDNPKDKRFNCKEKEPDYVTTGYVEYFQEWAERDLKATMLRDRNHPCVIQWSIGNEIEWTYPRCAYATGYFDASWEGNYFFDPPPFSFEEIKKRFFEEPEEGYSIGETARKLAKWTRSLDATRPVTANCILPSVSHVNGYGEALDMVGYSYRRVMYDACHKEFPDKPIYGAENLGQWHEWKAMIERPFISAYFLWTGIDYMGEANDKWPAKSLSTGIMDLGGFKKPSYHIHQCFWKEDVAHTYIATQVLKDSLYELTGDGQIQAKDPDLWERALWIWQDVNEHWNYASGQTVAVEVYSNCEEVELFLNGKTLGNQRLADHPDHIYKWAVPFDAGTLIAKGKNNGKIVSEYQIQTSTNIAGVKLDVEEPSFAANGYDVCHVVAQLVDDQGVPVQTDDQLLSFEVEGDCQVLGVDNGAADNVQDHKATSIVTSKGRALMILGANTQPDTLRVSASAANLRSNVIEIEMTQES